MSKDTPQTPGAAGRWFPDIRQHQPCAMTLVPIPAVCLRCGSTCVDPCHDLVAQLEGDGANGMTWDEWSAELIRLGGDRYGPRGVIVECGTGPDGQSAWRQYYDDGYSPRAALEEDASYAE